MPCHDLTRDFLKGTTCVTEGKQNSAIHCRDLLASGWFTTGRMLIKQSLLQVPQVAHSQQNAKILIARSSGPHWGLMWTGRWGFSLKNNYLHTDLDWRAPTGHTTYNPKHRGQTHRIDYRKGGSSDRPLILLYIQCREPIGRHSWGLRQIEKSFLGNKTVRVGNFCKYFYPGYIRFSVWTPRVSIAEFSDRLR